MERELTLQTKTRLCGEVAQPLAAAIDVTEFDVLDFELRDVVIEGPSLGVRIALLTSMDRDSETTWLPIGEFPAVTSDTDPCRLKIEAGFLRFVRWSVTSLGGADALSFSVRGSGRTFCNAQTLSTGEYRHG